MHVLQILLMPEGLKVSADDQKVELNAYLVLERGELRVDLFKFAVQTAFHCHLYKKRLTFMR